MSTSKPEVGDEVLITRKGVVTHVYQNNTVVYKNYGNGISTTFISDEVQIIRKRPSFKVGEVCVTKHKKPKRIEIVAIDNDEAWTKELLQTRTLHEKYAEGNTTYKLHDLVKIKPNGQIIN